MTENLKFSSSARITHSMLNKEYGEHSMFYEKLEEAESHKKNHGGEIYNIVDYFPISDFNTETIGTSDNGNSILRFNLKPDAKPHIVGYLVSHPQSY